VTFDPRHLDGHLEANGDFHTKLHGVLTLHGAQHDVVIEAQGRLDGDRLIATCHLCVAKYHLKRRREFERGHCSVCASGMSQGLQLAAEEHHCAEPA
jgi:hypothetical protein